MSELIRALAVLAEPPGREHERVAAVLGLAGKPDPAAHTRTFLLEVYPYASVFLGGEGMLGGEARARVAGFWNALGKPTPSEPDHLSALLGLYASLVEGDEGDEDSERRVMWRHARRTCLWEHLLSWLGPFLEKVEEVATPFYRGWAGLLRKALVAELQTLGAPRELPEHLREAPRMLDPRDHGGRAFLNALLAPVRSGMVISRSDLARAAADLGLGLRQGERRYVLEALLSQDASGTLSWLAGEADRWSRVHESWEGTLGEIGVFWVRRAAGSAALLRELDPTEPDSPASVMGGRTREDGRA